MMFHESFFIGFLRLMLDNVSDYVLSLSNIMNNKVFYQHPNLMRALGMHETVMEVMVNVLGGGGDSKVTQKNNNIIFFIIIVLLCKNLLMTSERRSDSPIW